MCNEYDCNNNRPLGLQDAEMAWNERQRKAQTAMTSDIYTNGGLLDRTSATGYEEPVFYPSTIRQILERDFSYEELKFISGARLANMSMADIDRLISLLEKLKKSIKNIPTNGLPTPVTPSTPSWGTPYYGFGGSVQPLYGCPIPQDQRILNAKRENDLWTRKWGNLGEETGFDFPKDKEEDDKKEEEEMPSFLGSAWNDPAPVRTKPEKFYSTGGFPFPEKIGEKKPSLHDSVWNNKPSTVRAALYNGSGIPGAPEPGFKKTGVVLSADGISSKDDVQTEKKQEEFTDMVYKSISGTPGPAEPGQLKNASLKAILDYPSTGVVINDNPVSLTEENKSVDEEKKND